MNRGDRVFVETPGGRTLPGRYEFRVTEGEPLGHHSVYLDDNRGRVVVCGCRLQLPDEADQPAPTETAPQGAPDPDHAKHHVTCTWSIRGRHFRGTCTCGATTSGVVK